MVIVVTGAAGAGKTTIGRALANELGWRFVDTDDLHDAASVDRMRRGVPLGDAERWPWLQRVHAVIRAADDAAAGLVVACSALKESYRRLLASDVREIAFVFLDAPAELLHQRLAHRQGHFMPESLVDSQLATLEPPGAAVRVDANQPVEQQVETIRRALGL